MLLLILVVLSPHRPALASWPAGGESHVDAKLASESTSYFSFNATPGASRSKPLYAVFPLLIFRWRQTRLWLGLGFDCTPASEFVSATTLVAVFPPRHLLHFAAIGAASLFRWPAR